MKNVKRIVIYAVIVIAVIGCVVIVRIKQSSANKNKPTTAVAVKTTSVEVQTATTTEKNSGDTYKATLEAYQQGILSSKLSEKVVSVLFESGQYVNAGDTLVTLDDEDIQNNIKTAQSQLQISEQQLEVSEQGLNSSQVAMEKFQVNVDDAQRNYDRQKALFERKAIAQTDLEAAENTLNSAKADYDSGNASVETSKANIETSKANIEAQNVTIANYQDTLNNTVIKAPISGVISNKSVDIGQLASVGSALATVNDISSVYATIQVPQEKISDVKIGQAATVTVDGSDKTYTGTIQNMDSSADTTSRVFNCKVKIDNSDKSLLPGIYAKVNIVSDQKTEVITVPVNALVGNEGDYSVLINDNGTAKKQKVTIGETTGNNVEITSGVQAGDSVICTNTSTLQDGDTIDVVTKQDNGAEDAASK